MFRLENNVPHVYVNESRDFQLLCRLYDAAFASVKYSVDSLHHASATNQCNDALLDLLRYKAGLFKPLSCTKAQLRMILEVFPFIIRQKGSVQGVSAVLNIFHRMFGEGNTPPEFNMYSVSQEKQLIVTFPYDLKNTQLLVELLHYVLPAGVFTNIEIVVATRPVTSLRTTDTVIYKKRDYTTNNVVDHESVHSDDEMSEFIGTVGLTTIVNEINDKPFS